MLLLCIAAPAAVTPQPGPGDPRMRVVHYDPDQVVELRGTLGYQMTVEFGPDEKIENVAIGDSLGWQITPNRRANLLFVKPIEPGAVTNMTVITSLRRYAFALSVAPHRAGRAIVFGLRFDYPEPLVVAATPGPPPIVTPPPADVNHAYSYEGSPRNLPARVFDDGHATYFSFAESADYPAIFIRGGPGKGKEKDRETLANVAVRDGFVVVDQLAPGFVLRRGADSTTIINEAWHEPDPGPLSPRPHHARGHRHD